MDSDISQEVESITNPIVEKGRPERIILIGNAARGELTADSDVDFLVVKKDTPLYGADRIRELSRLIERNIVVDFLVYRPDEFDKRMEMGDPFLKAVVKHGKVLYDE